ncbi:MAG: DUF1993 domain-containing protein [Mesorhizobium sp.]
MPSLYDISVPVFIRSFRNLSNNLAKARNWAEETKIPLEDVTGARLIADMLPLTGQIQRASDTARFVPVRVGDMAPLPLADEEKTFDDLQTRIDRTVAFLKNVAPSAFDGQEQRTVTLKFGPRSVDFTGESYILGFAIPNFYFHVTTAYAIMRHKGVPLSKVDFLGS